MEIGDMHRSKDRNCPEENEVADVNCRTIFVRNLPYNLPDSELQAIFSEIGPVRRSFTVKEKGNGQHRGFGFVQFAVADDATRAVQEKDGTCLQGRKIMVTLAKRRLPFDHRRSKKESGTPQSNYSQKTSLGSKETNLHSGIKKNKEKDGKDAAKEASSKGSSQKASLGSKEKDAQKVPHNGTKKNKEKDDGKDDSKEASSTGSQVSDDNKPAGKIVPCVPKKRKIKHDSAVIKDCKRRKVVVDEGKSSARQRVARTVILGGLLSPEMREEVIECAKKVGPVESVQSSLSPQELKGRGLEKDGCKMGAAAIVYASVKAACKAVATLHGNVIGGAAVWARQLGGEGGKPRKLRVIVRNLPFKINEEKIRELFSSAGFVWEVNLPRKPDGQPKGFAFVSFTSKSNAERAITTLNGTILEKRTIAVDWAVERNVYESNTNVDRHSENKGEKVPSDIEDEETASESEEDSLTDENNSSDLEPSMIQEVGMAKSVLEKIVSIQKPMSNESTPLEHDTNEADNEITESKSSIEERPVDKRKKNTGTGNVDKTVFIKNLPFDVHVDDIKAHFATFGKVKSVYLVVHPKTKRPKGTAFLEFSTEQATETALAAARGMSDKGYVVNGIVIGGRKLEVMKALEKKSAKEIEKKKHENANIDRRNLYLAEEGKITGTAAATGVSEEDMRKRAQLEEEKATKLRSPNFHVSRTRLAVYNVPKSMKESELQKLFIDAVKSRATKQNPVIKKVIMLKDKAKGNKPRGIAFVEFSEHEHALVALRVLNNNPETFGPERRPIVGFALENLQKLKKQQQQQQRSGKPDEVTKGQRSGKMDDVKAKSYSGGSQENESKQGERRKRKSEIMNDTDRDSVGVDAKKRKHTRKQNSLGRKMKDSSMSSSVEVQGKHRNNQSMDVLVSSSKQTRGSQKRSRERKILERKEDPSTSIQRNDDKKLDWREQGRSLGSQKRKRPNGDVQDKLDELVAKYRTKYFAGASTTSAEKKIANGSGDIKRWFE